MLKPTDQQPGPEQTIGELTRELVEEAKAYARAEIDLAKAIANAKLKALVFPVILLGAAVVCALAAITALAVGVVIALGWYIGPLGAGFVGLLVFAALAGLLGWYGARRLGREF